MKQKMAFALALMMLLTSLTACGGKKGDGSAPQDGGASSSVTSEELDGTESTPEAPASSSAPEETDGEQDPAASAAQSAPETGAPAESKPAAKPSADTASKPSGSASKPSASTSKPASKPSADTPGKPQQPNKPEEPPAQPAPETPAAKAPAVADVAAAVENALAAQISFMELTADDLSAVYGLSSSAVEGFVCKMPMMNVQATEYFVAKAAAGQADTVKAAAVKRQSDLDATWSHYLPEQYELVQNYKLAVNGDYVLFVVGENAQAAVDAFNSLTR